MCKVSIILPVYNGEKTISDTICSVLRQTLNDFELLVINDGSTDRTGEIVKTFDDERIRVFSFQNKGLAKARNRGMKLAQGEFLSFIDDDDLWTFAKLADQVKALQENPDCDAAYSWVCLIDEHGQSVRPARPFSFHGNVYRQMLEQCFPVCGSNLLLRREIIGAVGYFNENYNSAEDWEYNIRVASRWKFALVPKYQIFYRQHGRSLSSNMREMEENSTRVITEAFGNAPEKLQYLKKISLSHHYQYLANKYIEQAPTAAGVVKAVQSLKKSFLYWPYRVFSKEYVSIFIKLLLSVTLPVNQRQRLLHKLYLLNAGANPFWQNSLKKEIEEIRQISRHTGNSPY
jgi:glycosyltransferase involved in cell wall biosynthesis